MATDKTVSGVRGWWARQSRKTRGILIGIGAVLLIALIGNVFGSDEETPPVASEPPTREVERLTESESVTEVEPTAEATEDPEPTSEPEPEPAAEPETPALAESVSDTMLATLSPVDGPVAASWGDLEATYTWVYSESDVDFEARRVLYGSSDSWPALVESVEDRTDSMVQVNLQVHSQSPDWDQDEISQFVANSFMVTAGPGLEGLDYVLVYSSDGVELNSLARRDSLVD